MPTLDRRGFCSRIAAAAALLPPGLGAVAGCAATVEDRVAGYPEIVGSRRTYRTSYEDTLPDLARRFGLGYLDIVMANPDVDPWIPGEDVEIVLPTAHIVPEGPRDGLLVNLADQRLYLFHDDGATIDTAPLGIGAEGWETPTGRTKIVRKKEDPTWYVPKSIRREQPDLPAVVPPGPDNPLGAHALYFDWPSYLLHGTNKPDGVGRLVSHGCVRLYPEDVARLYDEIAIGTPVTVIDRDLKIARLGDSLWIEVHLTQGQALEVERGGTFTPALPTAFKRRIVAAAGDAAHLVDWEVAEKAARERRGVPVRILRTTGFFGFLESMAKGS